MLKSNAFKATSFSFVFTAALLFEGCGSSDETASNANLCYYYYVIAKSSLPEFDSNLFYTADSLGQRLDIYVSLKESRLKFEKFSGGYRASYIAGVRLIRDGEPPVVKEIRRVVDEAAFPTASDSSYDAFLVSLRVTPGKYAVEIEVVDEASGQKTSRVYDKIIPDVSGQSMSMSDILLLASYDTVGYGRRIRPFFLSNAGLLSDTLRFFTVLSSSVSSRDSIYLKVFKLEMHERLPSGYISPGFSGGGPNLDPCRAGVDSMLVYSYPLRAALDPGSCYIFGGVPKPLPGNYVLEVVVENKDRNWVSALLPFRIRGKNFPDVTDDLRDMVNSLNYIASRGELQEMVAVKNDSAVKANLLKFWSDFGGYSKMAEYYRRVSRANMYFSTCIDGWKTPMGMMYIVCGPPDYVECRGLYTERWMYVQTSTNNRVVVDYRLSRDTPNPGDRYYGIENIYSSLDFWSYYVSRWRSPY